MSGNNESVGCGCGFVGSMLATTMSWFTFAKVGWAIVAFCFSWFYVLYYVIRYGFGVFSKLF